MARSTLFSLVLLMSASLASACDSSASPAQAAQAKPEAGEAELPTRPKTTAGSPGKPEPEAPAGTQYGAPLADAPAVTIEQVMDDPKAFENKVVRVEGMVTDVCTKRGCWFEMAGERPGMKMRFKVQDGDMVFPPSAKGHKAVAEGTVTVRTLSLEDTVKFEAHMAEDAGREFDPASVTEPMTIVQLAGQGAVIADS